MRALVCMRMYTSRLVLSDLEHVRKRTLRSRAQRSSSSEHRAAEHVSDTGREATACLLIVAIGAVCGFVLDAVLLLRVIVFWCFVIVTLMLLLLLRRAVIVECVYVCVCASVCVHECACYRQR